ncbi:hypothetical protein PsYK624_119080 [Phanerochaete sordida]|uniref:Uncharacterized protein n=1 Tax=Phanerochaete sordida TaxID=48140 RepID=A0A9P3GHI3_9APHY|nr:hypothetical protein PsYK624_119080 [Phanerochaete sordida]
MFTLDERRVKSYLNVPNPVTSLLSVSKDVRLVALGVLSKHLNIPFVAEGIGRLIGQNPTSFLLHFIRELRKIKQHRLLVLLPTAITSWPHNTPVLEAYYTIAILQRYTAYACAYARGELVHHAPAKLIWFSRFTESWMQQAIAFLARCPPAFRAKLAPRMGDAVARAHIAVLYKMHMRLARHIWWLLVEWDDRVGRNLDFVPLWAQREGCTLKSKIDELSALLRNFLECDRRMREAESQLQLPLSIERMLGKITFVDTLGFFQTVTKICDSFLYSMALFDECGAIATELSKTFKARADVMWPGQLS